MPGILRNRPDCVCCRDREIVMNTQLPSGQNFDFDFAPAMKLYMDSVEGWKQNYEKLLKGANFTPAAGGAALIAKPVEQAMSNWQAAGEALFKTFIGQQVELCQFFGRRWEIYRDYPRRISSCKTPAELAEVETEFLNRMAADYSHESAKLTKSMNDLVAAWAAGRPTAW
jgi:hypothetical protein